MKFLRRFVQEISSPQTNKLTNILTNEHPDTMLILWFLDSPDPKMRKSTKNRMSKICMITKVPHTYYDGELNYISAVNLFYV